MVNCKELYRFISDFIDEDLDAVFEEEMMEHISECEHCRSMFNTLRKTKQLLYNYEMVELPEETHTHLMEVIHIEIRRDIDEED